MKRKKHAKESNYKKHLKILEKFLLESFNKPIMLLANNFTATLNKKKSKLERMLALQAIV